MRAFEIVLERAMSDQELSRRGWDGNPETKWIYDEPIKPTRAATDWTCIDAIKDILGADRVTDDEDNVKPGQYLVYPSNRTMFVEFGKQGAIEIKDPNSRDAEDLAAAVHEACHAKLHKGANGKIYTNEKLVNQLAIKWLKENLTGMALHVATEAITKSKISYGHN
jgi:hypothetical protein